MAINDSVILRLEKLAKLKLSERERIKMSQDLSKMIGMIDKISEVNTDQVEPLVYMHEEKTVLRVDRVTNMLDKAEALANAPKVVQGQFAVPKVIDRSK